MDARSRLKALITEKCVLKGEFVLASGQRSKVFFDCKRVTLDPEGLHLIAGLILETIDDLVRRDGRPIDPVGGHVAGRSWERAHGPGTPTGPADAGATSAVPDTAAPAVPVQPAPRPL